MRVCLFQYFICRPSPGVCEKEREIQLLCDVSCVVNANKGFSKQLQTEMKVLSSLSLLILYKFACRRSRPKELATEKEFEKKKLFEGVKDGSTDQEEEDDEEDELSCSKDKR